jgi:hypothetical protein
VDLVQSDWRSLLKKPNMTEVLPMPSRISLSRPFIPLLCLFLLGGTVFAQRSGASSSGSEFGPVVSAYLGYLSNEQEVVDDRASQREITALYYRRNSNRIRALRQMAIRLARQTGNDYVPELEAVTVDELGTLFENPPRATAFRTDEIIANKFRFLAAVHSAEIFYVFARLDPYEQAELMQRQKSNSVTVSAGAGTGAAAGQGVSQTITTRPRRAAPK